jgi:serine/threonine-protein kinase HipA
MSAYPVLGHGANMLSSNKVKMAMAVSGTERHYHWNTILPRHLVETGFRCGLPKELCIKIIKDIAEVTPAVIKEIEKILLTKFPSGVAQTILEGLTYKVKQLANHAAIFR